jgi:hypothetical protein
MSAEHDVMATPARPIDDFAAIGHLLRQWLRRMVQPGPTQWLDGEIERQFCGVDERKLGIALGLVGRRIGRSELTLSAADLTAAQTLCRGWRPDTWTTDVAARVALTLATWSGEEEAFANRVDRLCATGELTEHVACLSGFAVFPARPRLLRRARMALRCSVQAVFEAISCRNPYPSDNFDDAVYNQMVLKCVFCDIPIGTIVGIDERRNDDLVRMLRGLISERHAAGRTVPDAVHNWIATPG